MRERHKEATNLKKKFFGSWSPPHESSISETKSKGKCSYFFCLKGSKDKFLERKDNFMNRLSVRKKKTVNWDFFFFLKETIKMKLIALQFMDPNLFQLWIIEKWKVKNKKILSNISQTIRKQLSKFSDCFFFICK